MTVAELISKLNQFPQDLEVTITDGYDFRFYRGQFSVEEFTDDDVTVVDIGVGGTLVDY